MIGQGGASALEVSVRAQALAPMPMPKYGSAREALRNGLRDYNAGDKAGAAQALEYAAGQGQSLALWKLGRMYADGDGVPPNDLKAFEAFPRWSIRTRRRGRTLRTLPWWPIPLLRSDPTSWTASKAPT